MSTQGIESRRSTSRVMLPDTARVTREAADSEDARKIRYGVSPSYFINLGHLIGNQFTGYNQIYPRTLYRFDKVHPTGINENPDRIDEEQPEQSALATTTRQPRTCAEDVKSEAGERVFLVFSSLTDRDDIADEVWNLIYPVAVEAEIFAMTDRRFRGPVPEHLVAFYKQTGVEFPYVKEGHALAAFIKHLEALERTLGETAKPDLYEIAEAARREALEAAQEAFRHRYTRLSVTFGLMQSRHNGGEGKNKLDRHDNECLKETGIEKPEDKPVLASQKMGEQIGQAITAKAEETENALASAVTMLAENQRAMAEQAAEDRKLTLKLLEQLANK